MYLVQSVYCMFSTLSPDDFVFHKIQKTNEIFTTNFNQNNKMARIASTLALGAGCYWGTEKFVVKDFQKKFPGSILNANVGFMSPDKNAMKNPSYRQVCSGSTGHVEVLHVELNNPELFEELIRFFFSFHDPSTLNQQGNDAGTQYASVIFCSDVEQKKIANKVMDELQLMVNGGKITTYSKKTIF